MTFAWPAGFARVPADDWTHSPLETLALKYDTVENHGWYQNLEPTLDELSADLQPGQIIVDYSGGTGILIDRLLRRHADLATGLLLVDSSPKFLRLALEKLGHDERVAFRWIRYRKSERRLDLLDEVLPAELAAGGIDALVSTNAIHLYYDLPDTLRAWARVLRPGGRVYVQSGNISNPQAGAGDWIIDETVTAVQPIAHDLVRQDERYAAFRAALGDPGRMKAHDELRRKYFLPVRPLEYYVSALGAAGFAIERSTARSIEARVSDWYEFLSAYHDGVLGWAGGTEKIEGSAPAPAMVALRQQLLRESLDRLFDERPAFQACWTYLTCRKPAA